jgi:hypothetical protein
MKAMLGDLCLPVLKTKHALPLPDIQSCLIEESNQSQLLFHELLKLEL